MTYSSFRQCSGSQCRCYTKNNAPLGAYAIESTTKGDMTCRSMKYHDVSVVSKSVNI